MASDTLTTLATLVGARLKAMGLKLATAESCTGGWGAQGALSEATARERAAGALDHSGAGVAVAVTGVAGPTGGSREKPVGTVCFAWALRGGAVESETCRFEGDRESIR